jgi:hypothetical protein
MAAFLAALTPQKTAIGQDAVGTVQQFLNLPDNLTPQDATTAVCSNGNAGFARGPSCCRKISRSSWCAPAPSASTAVARNRRSRMFGTKAAAARQAKIIA